MPQPQVDPYLSQVRCVAGYALLAGVGITVLKLAVFFTTQSVAVLSDVLESVINIAAAGMMLYSIWFANRPADVDHPYGHGKIEFMAVGLEGWLILLAGMVIGYEAIARLINGQGPRHLTWGLVGMGIVGVLSAVLGFYVWRQGRKYDHAVLRADGKHLLTDVASTFGVMAGLGLMKWTRYTWLDPVVAIIIASLIFFASWRLLWESIHGLMDKTDPKDDRIIRAVLDEEVASQQIRGYHKVRYRHTGPFHWVDMHLHVPGEMSVAQGHDLASRIERRVEAALGRADATAHLEPSEPRRGDENEATTALPSEEGE